MIMPTFKADTVNSVASNEDLIRRAMVAWFRAPDRHNEQPDLARSSVDTVGERQYVVLRNVNGVLAVYRIKSGVLRRLIRMPKEIV